MRIEFTVHGVPQPQGSAKAFIPKGWTRPVITSDNKTLKPWRQDVSQLAAVEMQGGGPWDGPVCLSVEFRFNRPKSVKSRYKTTKPDIDKLVRAIADSLTGIVFRDDSQITELYAVKRFADTLTPEGATVSAWPAQPAVPK